MDIRTFTTTAPAIYYIVAQSWKNVEVETNIHRNEVKKGSRYLYLREFPNCHSFFFNV